MERLRVELSRELSERAVVAARAAGGTPHAIVAETLERGLPALGSSRERLIDGALQQLATYLGSLPGVDVLSSGKQRGLWWVKFNIELVSPAAWHVVQQLGFILNFISLSEVLPTVFKPVSPPPYLNGGLAEALSWVIESTQPLVDPAAILAVLQERLPAPNEKAWTARLTLE